ncbi:NAD(P)-dependent dehydrogenase (short-subunit alcohol dehydrogenase family) [Kribbella sp. VKM Ac-2527]|uniref:NAD(P)-dependent dehydrogenase (Short-subunit alcohol dehydrogenase family) n=1 Tax=Kribbella caucasensis TaxID=2512215 RepID=A0A4V3CAN3_9ACTN|nr:glucose 1-dehydrogenase [Kribbella sp. VKM Ac-2527]TDO51572.1 NAD(P)-dependent dehydrogenase (short-subunit alcohol dehydrogenase family) [Kribbella sp. VKM Ac-2527]
MTQPTYDFSGRVAFVTGAGSGMGAETARWFARAGAGVVLADIHEALAQSVAKELADAGLAATAVHCDVADEDQVAHAVQIAASEFGRLDYAFNAAGIHVPATDIADEDAKYFDHINAVNLRGVWASMKHELSIMRRQDSGGAVVNCSSISGLIGNPQLAAYDATKFGIIGLTKSVALHYADRGVRVNVICPGTFDTPMVRTQVDAGDISIDEILETLPMRRIGTVDEIASVVLWLCSAGASFITGAALPVDGGFTAQ